MTDQLAEAAKHLRNLPLRAASTPLRAEAREQVTCFASLACAHARIAQARALEVIAVSLTRLADAELVRLGAITLQQAATDRDVSPQ